VKPLCIDLFCGLGGWTEGFLAEGYDCIGFDNERHCYPVPEMPEGNGAKHTKPVEKRGWTQGCAVALGLEGANAKPCTRLARYPAQLVLQNILTLHGSQLRHAAVIVASPPCQKYSYMAQPWGRAKREASWQRWERSSPFGDFHLNDLFDACFRIQREASEAAGRYIPLIVENAKGAQPWVGPARWHFGSFYLWGDVPALMPGNPVDGTGRKGPGGDWFADGRQGQDACALACGIKQGGSGEAWFDKALDERRKGGARKAASAQIAKIPFELSSWIARCYRTSEVHA
jgi:hypothetical protein